MGRQQTHENLEDFMAQVKRAAIKEIYLTSVVINDPLQYTFKTKEGQDIPAVKKSSIIQISACDEKGEKFIFYSEAVCSIYDHAQTLKTDSAEFVAKTKARSEEIIKAIQKDYEAANVFAGSTRPISG